MLLKLQSILSVDTYLKYYTHLLVFHWFLETERSFDCFLFFFKYLFKLKTYEKTFKSFQTFVNNWHQMSVKCEKSSTFV